MIILINVRNLLSVIAEFFLSFIGYTAETARDGEEALRIFMRENDTLDAVTLDLTMPGLLGQMALRNMSGIDPDCRIFIPSGHSEELTRDGILAQANGSVSKSYKMKDLALIVRKVLDS